MVAAFGLFSNLTFAKISYTPGSELSLIDARSEHNHAETLRAKGQVVYRTRLDTDTMAGSTVSKAP